MTNEQIANPYRAPEIHTNNGTSPEATLYFAGSMTLDECIQALELTTGKKNGGTATYSQLAGILFATLGLFGVFLWEAVVYDETDQLFELWAGSIAVAAVLVAGFLHRRFVFRKLRALKEGQSGYFTPVRGRIDHVGVDFLIGDFPLSYSWADLVGAKCHSDAAVLFIDHPKEFNLLAASMFSDRAHWEAALNRIRQHVVQLGVFASIQVRKPQQRLKHIAAGFRSILHSDHQTALKNFEDALQESPDDHQALRGQLVAAIANGDRILAWRSLHHLVTLGYEDKWTRRYRADLSMQEGHFGDAISDYDWLAEHCLDDASVLRDRGFCRHQLGQFDKALADATAALQLDSQDTVAMNNQGAALLKCGQPEEAVRVLRIAVAAAPKFERPRQLLSEALAEVEQRILLR